jgi:cytochrome c oxidase subunit III
MSECLHAPFVNLRHQRDAVALGMWTFLAQELLFFGVLFVAYAHLRVYHPELFARYGPSLDWRLATAMTAALLVSSFTMALAVRFAFEHRRRALLAALLATASLGVLFLVLKGQEYAHHIARGETPTIDLAGATSSPGQATFFGLYYVLTGFHALHVIAGIVVLVLLFIGAWRRPAAALSGTRTMAAGLYWHFVDIVWLFLFPALYLAGRVV